MNIAIDIRSLIDGRNTGVEEYTSQLVQRLIQQAPQHTFHLFYNAYKPTTVPQFVAPNVTLHAFRYPNKLFNALQWSTHLPRWDRLVTADCFFIPALRHVPLSPHIPLVATIHDLSFEHFPHFFSFKRRVWHYLMQPRKLVQRAQHLIAVSEATRRDVMTYYGVPASKISTVHSGTTTRRHRGNRYDLPKHFILFVGTIEPRKNLTSLLKAYEAIASSIPHHLVVAGATGWLMQSFLEAIQNSVYRDRIHFLGFVAEEDKPELYAKASLFVYPSFYEGFGFPPLEALLAGTPVITSASAALPEIVGTWATLINPYDTSELAYAMTQHVTRPQRISVVQQEHIRRQYNWELTASKTLAILEQVYANRS